VPQVHDFIPLFTNHDLESRHDRIEYMVVVLSRNCAIFLVIYPILVELELFGEEFHAQKREDIDEDHQDDDEVCTLSHCYGNRVD
jgi:hypothetical protein